MVNTRLVFKKTDGSKVLVAEFSNLEIWSQQLKDGLNAAVKQNNEHTYMPLQGEFDVETD